MLTVVRVVVAEEDVGHGLGRDAEIPERVEDERAAGDHPGVGDDQGISVADEDDRGPDTVVRVAGVEQVDGGHARSVGGPYRDRSPGATSATRRRDARPAAILARCPTSMPT